MTTKAAKPLGLAAFIDSGIVNAIGWAGLRWVWECHLLGRCGAVDGFDEVLKAGYNNFNA